MTIYGIGICTDVIREWKQRRPIRQIWPINVIAFVYIPLDNSLNLCAPLILFTSLIDIANCKCRLLFFPFAYVSQKKKTFTIQKT